VADFSPAEDAFLREYWERHSMHDLASMTGRSAEALSKRGRVLGLKPRREVGKSLNHRKPAVPAIKPTRVTAALNAAAPWPDGWSITQPTKAQLMGRR
jgi:hypothetical protein